MVDLNLVVPPIVASILLFLTWFSFGLSGFSNNLFLISIYAMFVPCFFFTIGAVIEKMVVKKQIDRVVNEVKTVPEELGYDIPPVNIPEPDKAADKSVKDSNSNIIKEAFLVITVFFLVGIVVSYMAWTYSKKEISYRFIVVTNLILLILIGIVETLFFGLIILNYRSLDTNMIARTALETIGEKMKP